MVTILIFSDGRNDYLRKTLKSLNDNVVFDQKPYTILIDDNPDRDEKEIKAIKKKFKINKIVLNEENLGIFKNVQKAWGLIPKDTEVIFHLENDFTFNEIISFENISRPVLKNKHIFQVALLRQAWYPREIEKGGIYEDLGGFKGGNIAGVPLTLHRHYFTHNPCVYPRWVAELGKTCSNYSEYTFIQELRKKDHGGWCAYLGTINDPPKVTHIGEYQMSGKKSIE